nr:Rrf2 family transcriptional regulator [Lachnospiraceae bacterium]
MITTRGRYAIRVLLDIAEHDEGKYIPLKDIAQRQDISKKYLEIIVKDLVAAKLLVGTSGRGGGYKLSKKPTEYCIGEIIELLDGPLAPVTCLKSDS